MKWSNSNKSSLYIKNHGNVTDANPFVSQLYLIRGYLSLLDDKNEWLEFT